MSCLKCGKELKTEQAFCPHCLSVMEAYPVKPDIHVQLPIRTPKAAPKKAWIKRRIQNPEEQVHHLKKIVRILAAMVLFLTLILCFTCAMLSHTLLNEEAPKLGKNYTYDHTID